ncbi:MAG: hypothetical protein GY706_12025 [Bacteroides sp.]|nr:hypothetical protein [Bacteroides sp.]
MEKICKFCGRLFPPHPRVPNQECCTLEKCKREQRRIWQKKKRATDKDYLENQIRVQEAWLEENPGYWKKYREDHPKYTKRNRELTVRSLRRGLCIRYTSRKQLP